jgi:hypothetical protein
VDRLSRIRASVSCDKAALEAEEGEELEAAAYRKWREGQKRGSKLPRSMTGA